MLPEFFIFAKDKQILWHCLKYNDTNICYLPCKYNNELLFTQRVKCYYQKSALGYCYSDFHVPFMPITSLKGIYFPYTRCGL